MSIPTLPDSPYHYGVLTWGYANNPGFEQVRFVVPTGLTLRNGHELNALCFVPVFGENNEEKACSLAKTLTMKLPEETYDLCKSYRLYDPTVVDLYLNSRPQPGSQKAIQAEIERLERELKQ